MLLLVVLAIVGTLPVVTAWLWSSAVPLRAGAPSPADGPTPRRHRASHREP